MSDVEAAIQETAAVARRLLFNRHGRRKDEEAHVGHFTLVFVIPEAKAVADALDPIDGIVFFDWQGSTHAYNPRVGEVLIDAAKAGDQLIDRALCCGASIMLDALGGIPDSGLRNYIGARLANGFPILAKRKRGQKKTKNDYRDGVIAWNLIRPLLGRFKATRNDATRQKGKTESACSIVCKALARTGRNGKAGINMSEQAIEDIYRKYARVLGRS
jgi:hypothetical protein